MNGEVLSPIGAFVGACLDEGLGIFEAFSVALMENGDADDREIFEKFLS